MNDNLKIKRPTDVQKVNVHEPYEVNYCCKELGVTEPKLKEAVKKVGVMVLNVKKYLGSH